MDMYQKRKIRKEKKNSENNEEKLTKVGINWLITINLNHFRKHCKIRENSK